VVQPILTDFGEELLVACPPPSTAKQPVPTRVDGKHTLLAPKQADKQDARAVDCKQRADGVKLGREDLEYDERKGKLSDGGPDVGAFEGPLRCADLDELGAGEHNGARAVQSKVVAV
jgi:hypothetical protein